MRSCIWLGGPRIFIPILSLSLVACGQGIPLGSGGLQPDDPASVNTDPPTPTAPDAGSADAGPVDSGIASGDPQLVAEPASISIFHPVSKGELEEREITLSDASGGSYPWTLEVERAGRGLCSLRPPWEPWLSVSATSGDELPATITVRLSKILMDSGTCNVDLKFQASGAAPINVSVEYSSQKQLAADPEMTRISVTHVSGFDGGTGWPPEPITVVIHDEFGGSYPWAVSNILYPARPDYCTTEPWLEISPTSGDRLPAELTLQRTGDPAYGIEGCPAEFEIFGGRDRYYDDEGEFVYGFHTLRYHVLYYEDVIR